MQGVGTRVERLVRKYTDKLIAQGLCSEDAPPLMGGLDAELFWNRDDPDKALLEEVVQGLNINTILLAQPAEPYRSILDWLASQVEGEEGVIQPEDSETRTFLHDIPVTRKFEASRIITALKRRKNVIIPGKGIVTFGMVSPEQAFIHFSSVCFSCFVKFFSDYREDHRKGRVAPAQREAFLKGKEFYKKLTDRALAHPLPKEGPYETKEKVLEAMLWTGKATVACGMVDSFFGNISYLLGDTIFISQTTSSLDELQGCIDACPVDGSSSVAITASSEFSVHKEVLTQSGKRAILHGHPRFSVIVSMICDEEDCPFRGRCFTHCPKERYAGDVPIVPGEAGRGPRCISTTLPPPLKMHRAAIVYGHGLFCTGKVGYREAFYNLVRIEADNYYRYMEMVGET